MKKGMLAGCMLVLLSGAPAVFAADRCPTDNSQITGEYSPEMQRSKTSYLGVEVNDIDSDRVAELKLKNDNGVEVLGVDQDAPAGKAGFKEHDVILAVNGAKINNEEELRKVIRDTPPGRSINVLISRNGTQMTLKPTLASRSQMAMVVVPPVHVPEMHIEAPMAPMPPMNFPGPPDVPVVRVYHNLRSFGAQVENLTPQLRDFFGVKNDSGILVRSVEKGSPAEMGGLKAGDIIVRIGQERVTDSSDLRRLMRRKSGDISIGIVRDKREQNVTVKLPAMRETGQSWDGEDFEFDFQPQIESLRKELKNLPRITEEQKMAMLKAQKDWKKDFEKNKAEWQKSIAEAQKNAAKDQQKAMEELQREMEKMQKNFHYISLQDFE